MNQNDPSERYRELAEKWLKGTITEKEVEEYASWYDDDGDGVLPVPPEFAKSREEHRQRMLLSIEAGTAPVIPFYRKTAFRIAAAGIVLFALCCLWVLKRPDFSKAPVTRQQALQDLAPGSDRATLTLADGSVITLDSAATGTLAHQDGTHIIKQADGAIAYQRDSYDEPSINVQPYNVLATPRGGQYALTLPDGSRVWLNAASSLQFPIAFTGKERLVKLIGEAYFEVAKNAAKPFKVVVNGTTVEALGTAFNINAYTDEAAQRTTLVHGKVKITHAANSVILEPGQQASITETGNIKTGNVNTDGVTAWKAGLFQFENADLETIMRQLSRWYDVDVKFSNKIAGTFSATIERSEPISKVFKMLEFSGRVMFQIDKDTVIVQASKKE